MYFIFIFYANFYETRCTINKREKQFFFLLKIKKVLINQQKCHTFFTFCIRSMQAATEICNYYKLQYLLKHSQVLLRNLFKNRYIQFNDGAIWDDTLKCGSSIKLNKKSLNKIQQASVAEGDSNQWDFSTLMQLLLGLLRPNTLNPSEIQQCIILRNLCQTETSMYFGQNYRKFYLCLAMFKQKSIN